MACVAFIRILSSVIHSQLGLYSQRLADRRHLNHHLTGVGTSIEVNETLRRSLQATRHNVLFALELTLGQPSPEILECSRELLRMIEDNETLQGDPLRLSSISRSPHKKHPQPQENSQSHS